MAAHSRPWLDSTKTAKERVSLLLNAMTVEEKRNNFV